MKTLFLIIVLSITQSAYSQVDWIVTHHDMIPRFVSHPTAESVQDGDWNDAATWGGTVPGETDVVRINHSVVLKTNQAVADLEINGSLTTFGAIFVDTITVMESGTLKLEDGTTIVFRGAPFKDYDVEQFGNGLIVLGSLYANGSVRENRARCVGPIMAGASSLVFESVPSDWQVGDVIGLPDTRGTLDGDRTTGIAFNNPAKDSLDRLRLNRRDEELVIGEIAGNTVTFETATVWEHPAAYDRHGVAKGLPYACNLTRGIKIMSANPEGNRGHILIHGTGNCSFRGVEVDGMGRTRESKAGRHINPFNGRPDGPFAIDNTTFDENGQVIHLGTNQNARYALHWHHYVGPANPTNTGYQFECVGCVVKHFTKWGYVVHGTSYGLLDNNVAWSGGEAGFMTESGGEHENRFINCCSFARSRMGFWLNGPRNYIDDCVAGSVQTIGFWFTSPRVLYNYFPVYRGQHPADYVRYHASLVAPISCTNNEAFSAVEEGLVFATTGEPNTAHSKYGYIASGAFLNDRNYARGLKVWHAKQATICYLNFGIEIEDFETYECQESIVYAGTGEVAIRNMTSHNCRHSVNLRGRATSSRFWLEDSELHILSEFGARFIKKSHLSQNPDYRDMIHVFRNVKFFIDDPEELKGSNAGNPEYETPNTIRFNDRVQASMTNRDVLYVNGFQLFSNKQHPDHILTVDDGPIHNPNAIGMSNEEAFETFGIAYLGDVATCFTPLAGQLGEVVVAKNLYACPVTDDHISADWEFTTRHNTPPRILVAHLPDGNQDDQFGGIFGDFRTRVFRQTLYFENTDNLIIDSEIEGTVTVTINGDNYTFDGYGTDWLSIRYEGSPGDDTFVNNTNINTNVRGFAGDDFLQGGSGVDVFKGGEGDDVLRGGAGDDTLNGGDGDDILFGEAGNDILNGRAGNDEIHQDN